MSKTILYIEDDPASRQLVSRTLQFAGYHVLVAERGLEGIDIARRENPDLILTDINLPDLSGREITARLRAEEKFKHTPIVALTAQGPGEYREMALAVGVSGYLTKPVDVEALPGQIANYMTGTRDVLESGRTIEVQQQVMGDMVRQLEETIRKLEANNLELKRLDKVKESFIQKTAHELRTPLAVVFGYSRMLEDAVKKDGVDENLRMMAKMLVEAIQRMHGTINEIVMAGRIMTSQIDLAIANVNLLAAVNRAMQTYAQAAEQRKITIHVNQNGFPNTMRADPDRLVDVISNLLSNAIKYTPDGGHVYITATTDNIRNTVRLSVRDTGVGLSADEQKTVFEKFSSGGAHETHSTSKTAYMGGGLGLGLTIAKGIVEGHGGKIWVESPGKKDGAFLGSEFFVELPLVATPIPRARPAVATSASGGAR
jgi:signal transduction histidine kinase